MKSLTIDYLDNIPFDVLEAVNQLRVNLSFSGKGMKKILITSSIPNEGKSFVSLALWKAIANVGKKVLFVDADLRESTIRSIYNIHTNDNFIGLAHVLSGQCGFNDVIYKTNFLDAYMLPVTNDIINPSILLESEIFKDLLDSCAKSFDYVVIDTPPIHSVPDALTIGKYVDGSLLVVRSNYTKRVLVKESIESLRSINEPFLGVVLNRADTSGKQASYYYYSKSYENYYVNGNKAK